MCLPSRIVMWLFASGDLAKHLTGGDGNAVSTTITPEHSSSSTNLVLWGEASPAAHHFSVMNANLGCGTISGTAVSS